MKIDLIWSDWFDEFKYNIDDRRKYSFTKKIQDDII